MINDKSGLMSKYNYKSNFINTDGTLDIKKVLVKFQEFMKHEYSQKRETFLEVDGRLIFLAFLSPIINGVGFAFKEAQGGEEYNNKGLQQLGEYLEQYGLDEGYLLTFDFRKNSLAGAVDEKHISVGNKDKRVCEVYC